MISYISKSNDNGEDINKKFCMLKELRTLKKKLMFNHREHSHYE